MHVMEVATPSVEIVMSAYNGAPYLGGQLDSLLQQTHQDFRLVAQDDGSTDGTLAILADYAERHRTKIAIFRDRVAQAGICAGFGRLLERTRAPYVMLCDQDDIWLPRKIEITLKTFQDLERQLGGACPILVHTDLCVVDRDLRQICPSCWKYLAINVERGALLPRLLIQNVVTGCTCMVNRALLQKALPISPKAVIHDWWLGLVASAFGRIAVVPEATVLYRQHPGNSVGAPRYGFPYGFQRLLHLLRGDPAHSGLSETARQAAGFLERFAGELPPEKRRVIEAFTRINSFHSLHKAAALLRGGFRKHGLLRNLGMFAEIVLD
jgi:glycosyltransferase involved in cell wall biosynthesis